MPAPTINLIGPSAGTGAPPITPAAVNVAVNSALASLFGSSLQGLGSQLTGQLGRTVSEEVSGTGTGQSSAFVLTSEISVVVSAAAPFRLPQPSEAPGGVVGPMLIKNRDATNTAIVYPPTGGQFESNGVGIYAEIPPGGDAQYVPSKITANMWYL